jgi:hypothetical protein
MPLLYFDVIDGRQSGEIKALLDTAHAAMVEALGVPERDRYQVVNSHPAGEIVALDTALSINRSDQLVIIHMISATAPATARRLLPDAPLLVAARGERPNRVPV